MPLQFSAEYPMVPPVQYSQSYMPAVPILNLGGELDSFVPYAAVSVANVLSSKATRTPLHVYMYNVCVDQNWRNPTFSQMVQLTIQAAVYLMGRGFYRDMGTAIPEAAATICAGYTGNLYAQHYEFQGRLPPDTVRDAQECSRQLTTLMSELTQFARTGTIPAQNQNYGQTYPTNTHVTMGVHRGSTMGGFAGGNFGVAGAPPAPNYNPVAASASRFAGNDVIDAPVTTAESFKFPEPTKPVAQPSPSPAPAAKPTTESVSDMDRNKHTILVFETVALDQTDTAKALALASRGLQSEEQAKGRLLYSNAVFEDNFEEFISSGRAKMVADQDPHPESRHGFYRVFGYYLKRFSQAVDLTSVAGDLLNTNGVFALITKLKSVSSTLNFDGENHRTSMMKLGFLVDLDNWLTDIVNSFLKHNLRSSISFTSFVEDYKALREAAPEYIGKAGFELLCAFEKKLLRILASRRNTLSAMDGLELGQGVDLENTDDGVCSFLMPVPASVTYCPLLSAELGFRLRPGQDSLLIDKTTAPVLYEMASRYREHADIIGIDTLEAWLCTVDNRLFRLYSTSITGETSFYISAK